MTIRRAHREAYDIMLSNFPEGAEREQRSRALRGRRRSRTARRALFAEQLTPARWDELAGCVRGLPERPALQRSGADETTVAGDGRARRCAFARGRTAAGASPGWRPRPRSASGAPSADLELIRDRAPPTTSARPRRAGK